MKLLFPHPEIFRAAPNTSRPVDSYTEGMVDLQVLRQQISKTNKDSRSVTGDWQGSVLIVPSPLAPAGAGAGGFKILGISSLDPALGYLPLTPLCATPQTRSRSGAVWSRSEASRAPFAVAVCHCSPKEQFKAGLRKEIPQTATANSKELAQKLQVGSRRSGGSARSFQRSFGT